MMVILQSLDYGQGFLKSKEIKMPNFKDTRNIPKVVVTIIKLTPEEKARRRASILKAILGNE
jgi:hypothetical protein